MDDVLDFFFELFLELFADGLFALIRKYVKNKFLRAILYCLTVAVLVAIAAGAIIGVVLLIDKFTGSGMEILNK